MFDRTLLSELNTRLSANDYRPVLVSGVNGCGKTTVAAQFAQRFAQTMLFDLSKAPDRQVFEKIPPAGLHFSDLFLYRNRDLNAGRTLLFIDNIHEAPDVWETITALPNRPRNLFILGASDVLDGRRQSADGSRQSADGGGLSGEPTTSSLVLRPSSFVSRPSSLVPRPSSLVPRPSSLVLHPLSFSEYLTATGETEAHALYRETPCPDHAHEKLLSLFHRYVMVGGMPEAVAAWTKEHSMAEVEKAFGRILAGWNRLLQSEIKSRKSADLAASLLADAFPFAASRISFHHFANRPVRSREASAAFRTLEELMFLRLIYPVTGTTPDALPETGRSPRIQFADTGMVIWLSGIRHPVSEATDLTQLVGGQVLRHVVGQEIGTGDEGRGTRDEGRRDLEHLNKVGLASGDPPWPPLVQGGETNPSYPNYAQRGVPFWVREKPQSRAEVDFVVRYGDLLVPAVARSGEPGRLRSLHSFLDEAPHPFAVRLCGDRLNIRKAETLKGKPFFLLSLPYYLASRISEHLDGFIKYVGH
jgi:uncharacterized protein